MQTTISEESAKVRKDARETSRLAALHAAPRNGSLRLLVLETLAAAGNNGMTDDELFDEFDKSPNSIRPRRVELVEGGWVIDTGLKRPSVYGNPSIVWGVTIAAMNFVKAHNNA